MPDELLTPGERCKCFAVLALGRDGWCTLGSPGWDEPVSRGDG